MHDKLMEKIQSRLMGRGYKHQEEHVVESYRYDGEKAEKQLTMYGIKPQPSENGTKLYEKKKTVEVADAMSPEDAMALLNLEQQETVEAMQKELAEMKQQQLSCLQGIAEHVSVIKKISIFFAALTAINLIMALIQAIALSGLS